MTSGATVFARRARLSLRRRAGLPPPPERIVAYHGHLRVWADPGDAVERHAWLAGSYEPAVSGLLQRLVEPGDVALDVGAHAGMHTLVLADAVGPTGRVIAFEPNPPTIVRLRRNIELNGFEGRVVIEEAAASDSVGVAELSLSDDTHNSGGASLGGQRVKTPAVPVRRCLIDDVVSGERAATVAVVKVDIEGHEAQALAGASRLLAARPAVVFESNSEAAVRRLEEAGYQIFEPGRGATTLSRVEPDQPCWRSDGAAPNLVAAVPGSRAWSRLGL